MPLVSHRREVQHGRLRQSATTRLVRCRTVSGSTCFTITETVLHCVVHSTVQLYRTRTTGAPTHHPCAPPRSRWTLLDSLSTAGRRSCLHAVARSRKPRGTRVRRRRQSCRARAGRARCGARFSTSRCIFRDLLPGGAPAGAESGAVDSDGVEASDGYLSARAACPDLRNMSGVHPTGS